MAILDEEVGRLPEKFRSPLVLCYLEGKTNEEAARALGCPTGTLKGRLLRARELLHERLTARGITLPAGAAAVLLATTGSAHAAPDLLARVAACGGRAEGLSAEATRLAAELARPLALRRLGAAAAVLLFLGTLGAGAALLARRPAGEPEREEPTASKRSQAPETKSKSDALGDELPDGAVARLGNARWRHGSRLSKLAFADGSKEVVTGVFKGLAAPGRTDGQTILRLWDARSGKNKR